MNFKDIHIGTIIKKKVEENGMDNARICNYMNCSEEKITEMYNAEDLNSNLILKWSKLLEYDFFRIYTQHLILYSPPKKIMADKDLPTKEKSLPLFRKNIYSREIIEFILELIQTGAKTKAEVIQQYGIPKTTLYKWIYKDLPINY